MLNEVTWAPEPSESCSWKSCLTQILLNITTFFILTSTSHVSHNVDHKNIFIMFFLDLLSHEIYIYDLLISDH